MPCKPMDRVSRSWICGCTVRFLHVNFFRTFGNSQKKGNRLALSPSGETFPLACRLTISQLHSGPSCHDSNNTPWFFANQAPKSGKSNLESGTWRVRRHRPAVKLWLAQVRSSYYTGSGFVGSLRMTAVHRLSLKVLTLSMMSNPRFSVTFPRLLESPVRVEVELVHRCHPSGAHREFDCICKGKESLLITSGIYIVRSPPT